MNIIKIIIALLITMHYYDSNHIENIPTDDVTLRCITSEETKFGFADENGKVIIQPIYDSVSEFHNGLAWGYDSDNITYYYFNDQGEVQCSFKQTMYGGWFIPGDYSDERIRVGTNFYDKNGNFIFGDYYYRRGLPEHEPSDFSEGLCVYPVLKNYEEISDDDFVKKFINYSENGIVDNWEYVFRDKYGNIVLGPYNYAGSFHNGYAKVKTTEGEYGFINKAGEFTKSEISVILSMD
jgi:hypothetical protein